MGARFFNLFSRVAILTLAGFALGGVSFAVAEIATSNLVSVFVRPWVSCAVQGADDRVLIGEPMRFVATVYPLGGEYAYTWAYETSGYTPAGATDSGVRTVSANSPLLSPEKSYRSGGVKEATLTVRPTVATPAGIDLAQTATCTVFVETPPTLLTLFPDLTAALSLKSPSGAVLGPNTEATAFLVDGEFTLSGTVGNAGNAPAPGSFTSVFHYSNTNVVGTDWGVTNLSDQTTSLLAGTRRPVGSLSWRPGAGGPWYFALGADEDLDGAVGYSSATGKVNEGANENNNTAIIGPYYFKLSPPVERPPLTCDLSVKLATDPKQTDSVGLNESISVPYDSSVHLRWDTTGATTAELSRRSPIISYAVESVYLRAVNYLLPNTHTLPWYRYTLVASNGTESCTEWVTVNVLPDLVPLSPPKKPIVVGGATLNSTSDRWEAPRAGAADFTVQPKNIGASFTDSFKVSLKMSPQGSGTKFTEVGSAEIFGGLAPFQHKDATIRYLSSTSDINATGYEFMYCVDDPPQIPESNENNNCSDPVVVVFTAQGSEPSVSCGLSVRPVNNPASAWSIGRNERVIVPTGSPIELRWEQTSANALSLYQLSGSENLTPNNGGGASSGIVVRPPVSSYVLGQYKYRLTASNTQRPSDPSCTETVEVVPDLPNLTPNTPVITGSGQVVGTPLLVFRQDSSLVFNGSLNNIGPLPAPGNLKTLYQYYVAGDVPLQNGDWLDFVAVPLADTSRPVAAGERNRSLLQYYHLPTGGMAVGTYYFRQCVDQAVDDIPGYSPSAGTVPEHSYLYGAELEESNCSPFVKVEIVPPVPTQTAALIVKSIRNGNPSTGVPFSSSQTSITRTTEYTITQSSPISTTLTATAVPKDSFGAEFTEWDCPGTITNFNTCTVSVPLGSTRTATMRYVIPPPPPACSLEVRPQGSSVWGASASVPNNGAVELRWDAGNVNRAAVVFVDSGGTVQPYSNAIRSSGSPGGFSLPGPATYQYTLTGLMADNTVSCRADITITAGGPSPRPGTFSIWVNAPSPDLMPGVDIRQTPNNLYFSYFNYTQANAYSTYVFHPFSPIFSVPRLSSPYKNWSVITECTGNCLGPVPLEGVYEKMGTGERCWGSACASLGKIYEDKDEPCAEPGDPDEVNLCGEPRGGGVCWNDNSDIGGNLCRVYSGATDSDGNPIQLTEPPVPTLARPDPNAPSSFTTSGSMSTSKDIRALWDMTGFGTPMGGWYLPFEDSEPDTYHLGITPAQGTVAIPACTDSWYADCNITPAPCPSFFAYTQCYLLKMSDKVTRYSSHVTILVKLETEVPKSSVDLYLTDSGVDYLKGVQGGTVSPTRAKGATPVLKWTSDNVIDGSCRVEKTLPTPVAVLAANAPAQHTLTGIATGALILPSYTFRIACTKKTEAGGGEISDTLTVPVSEAARPDLVASLALSGTEPVPGELRTYYDTGTIMLGGAISNIGAAPTPNGTFKNLYQVKIGNGAWDDLPTDAGNPTTLVPNTSPLSHSTANGVNTRAVIPSAAMGVAGTREGITLSYRLCADQGLHSGANKDYTAQAGVVPESDESEASNCSATITITVKTPPPLAPAFDYDLSANNTALKRSQTIETTATRTLVSGTTKSVPLVISRITAPNNGGSVTGSETNLAFGSSPAARLKVSIVSNNPANPTASSRLLIETFSATPLGNYIVEVAGTPSGGPVRTASFTVEVYDGPTQCAASLNAVPDRVTSGGSATLSWSSVKAASCTGIGFETGNQIQGSILTGALTANRNYTLSCRTQGATDTCTQSATVTVSAPPPPPPGDAPTGQCFPSPTQAAVGQAVSWTARVEEGQAPFEVRWTGDSELVASCSRPGSSCTQNISGTSGSLDVSYASVGTKNGVARITDARNRPVDLTCTPLQVSRQGGPPPNINDDTPSNPLSGPFNLRVVKEGTGSVKGDSGDLFCGTQCSKMYVKNTRVALTATAGSGFRFAGWSDACQGTDPICRIHMTGPKTVVAVFTQPSGSLSVSCRNSPTAQEIRVGNSITWSAFGGGGTAPYTRYAWQGENLTGRTTQSVTLQNGYQTGGTKTAQITITDSANRTANGSCSVRVCDPAVSVCSPESVGGEDDSSGSIILPLPLFEEF